MDKMRGPIRQITVNSATFEDCAVDLSYLNFFFGRNGAGKSTIARALGSGHGLTWDTTVDADDHSVMVYDRDFVEENFSTYESLNGVFTLGKANIEAEKELQLSAKTATNTPTLSSNTKTMPPRNKHSSHS